MTRGLSYLLGHAADELLWLDSLFIALEALLFAFLVVLLPALLVPSELDNPSIRAFIAKTFLILGAIFAIPVAFLSVAYRVVYGQILGTDALAWLPYPASIVGGCLAVLLVQEIESRLTRRRA